MDSVAILISALTAGGFLGAVLPVYFDCRALRSDLTARVQQFEAMLKTASDANLTHAAKILELEEKVNNVRMYVENTAQTASTWRAAR